MLHTAGLWRHDLDAVSQAVVHASALDGFCHLHYHISSSAKQHSRNKTTYIANRFSALICADAIERS